MKKTVVIGASPNSFRYAYHATLRLKENDHEFVPVGVHTGSIGSIEILDLKKRPAINNVNTVTMYISPHNQTEWIDYILSLKPQRIVFNPGAENPVLEQQARAKNIETINACTLVMLSVGNY